MSYIHDTYTVYGCPNAHGHIIRLRVVTLAFHAWNKFTLYLFGRRVIDTRNS